VVALVVGVLLVLPGFGLVIGGVALGGAYTFARDGDGWFSTSLGRVATSTAAVTAEDVDFGAEPGSPDWLVDALDADVRLQVDPSRAGEELFVGIGPADEVAAYLAGVAHEEIVEVDDGRTPRYRSVPGGDEVAAPGTVDFWVASASGSGRQVLEWEAEPGRWSVVLMRVDGEPGVAADVRVGVRSGLVLPLAIGLLVGGGLLLALGVVLIVVGATGRPGTPTAPSTPVAGAPVAAGVPVAPPAEPVVLRAHLDEPLSRWRWLVKWLLALPHIVVLAFLWLVFGVLTLVAGVAILVTGRYPRGIFDVNVGVLRWTWRVSFYAARGGLATDRYPPFTLEARPGDPATLDVAYPDRLSRPLVLVKWLLALPHLLIVAILTGGSVRWLALEGERIAFHPAGGGGLLGILVLVAAVVLLFTGRYPRPLFDLVVGCNRWVYRVVAYVALMTDRYPPFRLDQGGDEPATATADRTP
jgi:hypothetical protein